MKSIKANALLIFFIIFTFNLFVNSLSLTSKSQSLSKSKSKSKNLISIPLKKTNLSINERRKFFDFITKSQGDSNNDYENFLSEKSHKIKTSMVNTVKLYNFKNTQVILFQ